MAAWEGQLFGGELRSSAGERLQVVYRGRRNLDAGPDFQDAIIALADGRLLRGDVEVHVRTSDWRSHGHSRDRRYNGAVLHVVMWDDLGQPTHLANGTAIPVLALAPFLRVPLAALRDKAQQEPLWAEPCSGLLERIGPEAVRRRLDSAGQLRLAAKAAGFEAALACKGPGQAMYEGLLEALGYAKNREPFRQLAACLPLATLQGLLSGKRPEHQSQRAEALLLGVAGLLPSQRQQPAVPDYGFTPVGLLEEQWRDYGGDRALAEMTEEDWRFFRTRPENFPTRRIAGAAVLLASSLEEGLVDYLLTPLAGNNPVALRRSLLGRLMVTGGLRSNWAGQFRPSRLIGRGRAMVVAVNVVFPFALAFAHLTSQPDLGDRARWAYASFPKLPSDALVRQMSRQIFGVTSPDLLDSAPRQQALHYLYKEFCRSHCCGECPLLERGKG